MMSPRLRRLRRWPWYAAGVVALTGGLGAAMLLTPVVHVTEVLIEGARSVSEEEISSRFMTANLLTLNTARSAQDLKDAFPQFRDVAVTRRWPHRVSVAVTEREPRGIWCRREGEAGDDFMCQFWDDAGVRWGTVVPSTGPLLLHVRDERAEEPLDDRILQGVLAAVDGLPALGLQARMVTLPDAEPGGMRIVVDKRYELYLDALTDMAAQLDTLGIFLTERVKDPAFSPLYIDLRTPGRIYYK